MKKIFIMIVLLSSLVFANNDSDTVIFSKQVQALVRRDSCAGAAADSVDRFIRQMNYDSGADIPDNGYPPAFISQITVSADGLYSLIVDNYYLPGLTVQTQMQDNVCVASEPTYNDEM